MELFKPDQEIVHSQAPAVFTVTFLDAQKMEEAGDYPAAVKAYHEIIDSHPEEKIHFECLKNMGNIYLKLGDYPAAEEAYAKAQRVCPQHLGIVVNFGVLAMQRGNYQAAKDYFTEVIVADQSSDIAWVGVGLVHRSYLDLDLARACLLRALDESPTNKTALTTYYHWCEDDGVSPSLAYLENYLKHEPNDEEALQILTNHKPL